MRRLAWLLTPAIGLTLAACGGASEVDAECAALHEKNRAIETATPGESVDETMDRANRVMEIYDRMRELNCGPASDY